MWGHYLKRAVAALLGNRLYSAVSILSLTVGFAVALLIGIYARHELTYDRWLPDHGRLYLATQVLDMPAQGSPWRSYATRTDVAAALRADLPEVEAVTRLAHGEVVLVRGDVATAEPDFAWADPNIFDLLKMKPIAGDLAHALAAPDGLVLTRSLARKYFGVDAPIGRRIGVQLITPGAGVVGESAFGAPFVLQVTAVIEDLPPESNLKAKAFGSTLAPPIRALDQKPPEPFGQVAFTYVRLRPGATPQAAQARLPGVVAHRIPPPPMQGLKFHLQLMPLAALHAPRAHIDNPGRDTINPPDDPRVIAGLAAIAGLVLLTAILNFVGLATARGPRRAVEVGVRKAVGARRRDLVAQFMAETLLQVIVALALALAIAEVAAPYVGALVQRVLRLDYTDPTVMAAVFGAALVAGLLAGAYPALVLSNLRPVTALKGAAGPRGSTTLRQGLVVAQFAVLVLLMVVVATIYRQTALALDEARRFGGEQVVLVGEHGFCGDAMQARLRAMQGVEGLSCFAITAARNGGAPTMATTRDGRGVTVDAGPMDAGFFPLFGIHPLAGRLFSADRGADMALMQPGSSGAPSIIVNESAARALGFASPQAAAGHALRWNRIQFIPGKPAQPAVPTTSEIVGVVPDFVMGLVREPVHPMIYWVDPVYFGTVALRIDRAHTPAVLAGLDGLWRETGHVRPMSRRLLEDAVRQAYGDVVILSAVIAVCAGVALVIACVGLFALAAFTAEQRTKEIGVRKALGAGTADLARLLLWQFTKPVLAACLIASPIAWLAMRRWLEGFPERVGQPAWLFAAAAATAVAIAWLTVGAHTLIMARARPVTALRYE
jgi:putative ABC transport system permease protein